MAEQEHSAKLLPHRPQRPEQLARFLREYVPVDRLGEVLAISAQWLLKNRHHPGSPA
ncbi:hypothetical protein [Acidithiobacillus ferriphilus]|uniref:hypothetical protein n=1 Tax=Acidithiobacillus ferriphilus TaxID=1689834 RepID=UPI001C07E0AD|nr:hypothetical protein [Acidithiobacillus ferriphilus]MBU2852922.1 hypothetical protein [Acidithiobacillus ferriphilus]